jgi:hypothetical protein
MFLFRKVTIYIRKFKVIYEMMSIPKIIIHPRAEPETIDRGCPIQINRIFGSKEILFFIIQPLFFSELRGCPGAGWRLPWISP